MEPIRIRFRGLEITRMVTGLIFIALGAFLLFDNTKENTPLNWTLIILLIFIGIINFTPLLGSGRIDIIPREQDLRIRWRKWSLWKNIRHDDIEKIVLGRFFILILKKEGKKVRLDIDYLKEEKKTRLFNFFVEYARQKNKVIERHGLSE